MFFNRYVNAVPFFNERCMRVRGKGFNLGAEPPFAISITISIFYAVHRRVMMHFRSLESFSRRESFRLRLERPLRFYRVLQTLLVHHKLLMHGKAGTNQL